MERLRVIDQFGNKYDYDTEFVPRIGERVVLEYEVVLAATSSLKERIRPHYYRVKDVSYNLSNSTDVQASILIEEEDSPTPWPS